jgi:hypothetical protein
VDVIVTGDMRDVEQEGEFDLAVTVRSGGRINSGVVFVLVSEKTKEWYRRWYELVLVLLDDPKQLRQLKSKYAGINQSALETMLLEPHDLVVKKLPCNIWNCTPICYPQFNEQTKVVHLLEQARRVFSRRGVASGPTRKVISIWNELERRIGR